MMEVASSSSACQFEANLVNNNNNDVKPVRPKRDFRFKVIEVQNGPKWFVWPSRNRGSTEDVDENDNKKASQPQNNGYGALRRSVIRQSKRKQDLEAVTGRTASEPASARRLSAKKEKAVTEPLNQVSSMFKIISIEKNWESFDATDNEDNDDELEEGARTVSVISLTSVIEGGERRWTTSI
ncbi:hypothetical protein CAEBREN_01020 [Caenorhabditis brenneri]|uniref:Uncharacterized protein n=1 Tax=Caenorhabditis brenneri TaxID=135651 RepID=G0PJI4_CAEBE|nr:hypothetical protein CAEBREN_11450 [Caenorhabditis brenneri]EGT59777.1 hypothetical protein CAEBREN_01020 [Caenorhabditis brenneri]